MEGGVSVEDDQDDEQACCVSIHRVRRRTDGRTQFRGAREEGREALVVVFGKEEEHGYRASTEEGLGGRRGRGEGEDRRQQVSEAKLCRGREGGRE